MPIYEYQCQSCGHDMETIQKMSDDPLTDCPACGKPELKKLISAAGFQLKGAGWYETDFKGNGKRSSNKSASSGESASSGSEGKAAKSTGGCGTGACGCASGNNKH